MEGDRATLGCLPNPLQERLLTACLASGAEARKAWEAWLPQVDIDRLDFGSSKLLPLLYRNLRAQGVEHPVVGRLKGVYRATWFRNQVLLKEASAVIPLFRGIGVESMILKGAALILTAYGDIGARAMEDVDLLVPTARGKEVLDLLLAEGWTPEPWLPDAMVGAYFAVKHGFNFRHRAGRLIDLHWHAMDECIAPWADDDFWAASRPLQIHGQPVRTLCPSDHLLHAIAHGVRWNPIPPLRWVADAVSLIRKEDGRMDWGRLIEQARRRNLVLPVKEGLRYVARRMDAPVPPAVIDDLDRSALNPVEHVAFRVQTSDPSKLGPLWRIRRQHARYLRVTAGAGPGIRMIRLMQFLGVGLLELFRDHLVPALKHRRRKEHADS
jgi:hypothetical protein